MHAGPDCRRRVRVEGLEPVKERFEIREVYSRPAFIVCDGLPAEQGYRLDLKRVAECENREDAELILRLLRAHYGIAETR